MHHASGSDRGDGKTDAKDAYVIAGQAWMRRDLHVLQKTRYRHLSEEIAEADGDLRVLITGTAPGLLALQGVGTETAGQLLVTAGDNPDRTR